MKTARSSKQQPLGVLGNVLKAAALGLVGAVIFAIAVVIGYQAEKQASRYRTPNVDLLRRNQSRVPTYRARSG